VTLVAYHSSSQVPSRHLRRRIYRGLLLRCRRNELDQGTHRTKHWEERRHGGSLGGVPTEPAQGTKATFSVSVFCCWMHAVSIVVVQERVQKKSSLHAAKLSTY